jgi:hypothetical protein
MDNETFRTIAVRLSDLTEQKLAILGCHRVALQVNMSFSEKYQD